LRTDVEQTTNVGVAEAGDGARFALEALLRLWGIRQLFGENFDGHGAVQAGILGAIDFAHPPRA
jgi:hypothetical protein